MLRRLLDSPRTYFIGAGLLLVIAIASQFELRIPSRPRGTVDDIAALSQRDDLNVVFILIDTLRADRLGIYGYERATTPVIDQLASYGVVFKHVISQSSWTKSSMASMWTATNPIRNGILRYNQTLPQEVDFPAEIFKRAGFRTAGIWRNGWVAPNFGFGQGFDTYVKPVTTPTRQKIQRSSPSARKLKGTDADCTASAVEFLRNFGNERFFLYMHFMDLHQYVFDNQSPDFGTSYSDAYDRSLNWVDRIVGQFLYDIDELDLLAKTVVVISSDHGEAFQEHGFEGHARNLYREVARVPLIILLPFVLDRGIVVEPTIANLDVWPTILDLLGLPPMKGVDGVSQLPLILEAGGAKSVPPTDGLRRPIFAEIDRRWGNTKQSPDPLVSVTDERMRMFFPVKDPAAAELYDESSDPLEKTNVAKQRPEELATYRKLAEGYLAADQPPWGTGAGIVEIDELELNQLKALGYRVGQ
jgi:arylsulfatase A-like enzyme